MSYYILTPSCNTPETGSVYPQIQTLKADYNTKSDRSIYTYLKKSINEFPDEKPDLDSFVMHNRAKITDFISNGITNSGFFFNKKVKSIFEKHTLVSHRFYSAPIIYRKKLIDDYFWCHMISNFTDMVDYQKSTFFIYRSYRLDDGNIKIDSLTDYFEKRQELQKKNPGINITIWSKRICLQPSFFAKKLDIFKIGLFDASYFISEALKSALIDENITGCDISPTDKIIISD